MSLTENNVHDVRSFRSTVKIKFNGTPEKWPTFKTAIELQLRTVAPGIKNTFLRKREFKNMSYIKNFDDMTLGTFIKLHHGKIIVHEDDMERLSLNNLHPKSKRAGEKYKTQMKFNDNCAVIFNIIFQNIKEEVYMKIMGQVKIIEPTIEEEPNGILLLKILDTIFGKSSKQIVWNLAQEFMSLKCDNDIETFIAKFSNLSNNLDSTEFKFNRN